jgi:nucleoside-diphosphate-sugar epimerase
VRILVTGATGFLGGHLVKRLLEQEHELLLLVRKKRKLEKVLGELFERHRGRITILEGDVTAERLGLSAAEVEACGVVDAVYHLASLLSFDPADRERTHQANVVGTERVLAFAKATGVRKFLYVSTAYTLGLALNGVEELYAPEREFVNEYERTKCLAEHAVMRERSSFSVIILRPAIVVGDSRTGEAETSFGLYGLLRGMEILKRRESRKPGWEQRTYALVCPPHESSNLVPVDYVCDVLLAALEHGEDGKIYNITNEKPPVQELVFRLAKEALEFPNVFLCPEAKIGELSPEERAFNEPLQVFAKYWSRTITFADENTQGLLRRAGLKALRMDEAMLERIIRGYCGQGLHRRENLS